MEWILYIAACLGLLVAGFVVLFVILMVWGFLHRCHSQRTAEEKIKDIEVDEIPALAKECSAVFEKKFGAPLDINDWEDASQKLDAAFQDVAKLKLTFETDGS